MNRSIPLTALVIVVIVNLTTETVAKEGTLDRAFLLERADGGGPCVASAWTAQRSKADGLVTRLRKQGEVVWVEKGLNQQQVGYRVVESARVLLHSAAEKIAAVNRLSLGYAAVAVGADGRPTISYGFFKDRGEAARRLRELDRAGFDAVVEPGYATLDLYRVVMMVPVNRLSSEGVSGFWHTVDCDAIAW